MSTVAQNPCNTDDGILIIEDVQDFSWLHVLCGAVPENLHKFIKMYDLKKVKADMFTINKSV